MGKFADLLPQPVEVQVSEGKSFQVKGVTLEDLSKLIATYRDDFLMLLYSSRAGGEPDYAQVILAAPNMVADLISMASGSPEDREEAKTLPFAVQLTALADIWRLSVPDPKKFQSLLSQGMEEAKKLSGVVDKLEEKGERENTSKTLTSSTTTVQG